MPLEKEKKNGKSEGKKEEKIEIAKYNVPIVVDTLRRR